MKETKPEQMFEEGWCLECDGNYKECKARGRCHGYDWNVDEKKEVKKSEQHETV